MGAGSTAGRQMAVLQDASTQTVLQGTTHACRSWYGRMTAGHCYNVTVVAVTLGKQHGRVRWHGCLASRLVI